MTDITCSLSPRSARMLRSPSAQGSRRSSSSSVISGLGAHGVEDTGGEVIVHGHRGVGKQEVDAGGGGADDDEVLVVNAQHGKGGVFRAKPLNSFDGVVDATEAAFQGVDCPVGAVSGDGDGKAEVRFVSV